MKVSSMPELVRVQADTQARLSRNMKQLIETLLCQSEGISRESHERLMTLARIIDPTLLPLCVNNTVTVELGHNDLEDRVMYREESHQ